VYKIETILNEEDIDTLNKVYDCLPLQIVKRYYNLFYLDKKDAANLNDYIKDDKLIKDWELIKQKFVSHVNLQPYAFYFLEYKEGSFCKAHTDNKLEVGLTTVTLIKKSDDLKGGEAVGYLPHWKSKLDVFDINRYTDGDECNDGSTITPVVMTQQLGETLSYAHNFKHSVSLVERGTRRVFICWFKK